MKAESKQFRATLERLQNGLGWTIARVPFDPSAVWENMVGLRVRAQIRGPLQGFAFRTSLFPDRRGGFFLLINRAAQAAAGVGTGDAADLLLEPDLDPREAELPDELAVLLEEEPGLRAWYDTLTEYTRREIGKWVLGVKSDEARMRRAQQTAERLLATMEAEIELPPMIRAAFRARPKARTGWEKMTPAQRRSELMAIFHYQTPEARRQRLDKAVDAAEKRAARLTV